ncbi:TadE/TadG family type IV pilus assembly protein [Aurantiacibacter spongiae]|uniref:Pilus assembly protein n=1 Tax=Aurantiacibacter spongiae TaxID=2488860 RepID=A0A3N5DI80_9SPHN|nr:TadE family protein [Aurantiacibacter spongiae]RPF70335.1 pilus assembly protein [Aurantiacibacter spongiae]
MMRWLARTVRPTALDADERGSMAIETAIVAPVLLCMALGGFEVSSMVARQTELQSAAAEAAAVVRAVSPETAAERRTVRNIVATSICGNDTPDTSGDAATCGASNQTSVTVTPLVRCGTATSYVASGTDCGAQATYKFIRVDLADRYDPIWTKWGITNGFNYNMSRTVQVG